MKNQSDDDLLKWVISSKEFFLNSKSYAGWNYMKPNCQAT